MESISKKEYQFYIDRKVTIWVREYHTIKSENEESAKKEMVELFHNNKCEETFEVQEYLYDTEDYIEIGDNGGNATAELFYYNNDLLTTNIQ